MKIKLKDIAHDLGISKATVSLALNNKPGVSDKTKARIEKYVANGGLLADEMVPEEKTILFILDQREKNVVCNSELDLLTQPMSVFSSESKKLGYRTNIIYFDLGAENSEELVRECSQDDVAGIVIWAVILDKKELKPLKKIKKPILIYDNEADDENFHAVVISNRDGVKEGTKYLLDKGKKDIVYLANTANIYNFEQRRLGFKEVMAYRGIDDGAINKRILYMGSEINEIAQHMENYLMLNRKLPQAFIMENYQVSLGVISALSKRGIRIPEDVALLGVDELPEYLVMNFKLTTINVPHNSRARIGARCLIDSIEERTDETVKIFVSTNLSEGTSV